RARLRTSLHTGPKPRATRGSRCERAANGRFVIPFCADRGRLLASPTLESIEVEPSGARCPVGHSQLVGTLDARTRRTLQRILRTASLTFLVARHLSRRVHRFGGPHLRTSAQRFH